MVPLSHTFLNWTWAGLMTSLGWNHSVEITLYKFWDRVHFHALVACHVKKLRLASLSMRGPIGGEALVGKWWWALKVEVPELWVEPSWILQPQSVCQLTEKCMNEPRKLMEHRQATQLSAAQIVELWAIDGFKSLNWDDLLHSSR